jgi:hypothetical protein
MGLLDEPMLEKLAAAGCPKCGGLKLVFRTYVDGLLPVVAGEPIGRITWAYDGEKFVDGVYDVTCAVCHENVFAADVCPRCHAPEGLTRALDTANSWPVPTRCPGCEGEEIQYLAFVPARVAYEGKRAEKAKSSTEIHDHGFHGYRVDCRDCGPVAERTDRCPLCEAPPPLRVRPG